VGTESIGKFMTKKIKIDGDVYNVDDFSETAQNLTKNILFVRQRIGELSNNQALLVKAKNSYIADLNFDIVQGRSGIDIGTLLSGD
jgi:hypothetical protein